MERRSCFLKKKNTKRLLKFGLSAKKELEKVLPVTLDKNGSTYDLFTSKARGTMTSTRSDDRYERSYSKQPR
jgi:hypothetical protein